MDYAAYGYTQAAELVGRSASFVQGAIRRGIIDPEVHRCRFQRGRWKMSRQTYCFTAAQIDALRDYAAERRPAPRALVPRSAENPENAHYVRASGKPVPLKAEDGRCEEKIECCGSQLVDPGIQGCCRCRSCGKLCAECAEESKVKHNAAMHNRGVGVSVASEDCHVYRYAGLSANIKEEYYG